MARKKSLDRVARALRLIGGALDPRAWAHAARLVNFYNYTHVAPRRRAHIAPDAAISPNVWFAEPERISIGARARIGARCCLWAGPSKGRIDIGEDALLGPDVMITAANYRFDDGAPVTDQDMAEADVRLGRDVWLGAKVVVLPGVEIGDGAVVGAGAVVTRSLPPMSVAVGAPARVVGARCVP